MDTQAAHQPQPGAATASFLGTRWGLLGVLLPGYLWILVTLGIFRFWQVTAKRRYYWSHTSIDGDALEYSGTAMQLLVGFLIALAFFLHRSWRCWAMPSRQSSYFFCPDMPVSGPGVSG